MKVFPYLALAWLCLKTEADGRTVEVMFVKEAVAVNRTLYRRDAHGNKECTECYGGSVSLASDAKDSAWWLEFINSSNFQTSKMCPYPAIFSIDLDAPVKFTLPNINSTFCYWELYNPKLRPLKIRLKQLCVLPPHS